MKVLCKLFGHKFKRKILEIYETPKVVTTLSKNCGTTFVSNCKIKKTCLRCDYNIIVG